MLRHPTIEKLRSLKLDGMARALEDQLHTSEIESLSFEERLGLLVDREETERANRRLKARLSRAKLRQVACIEDIDYRTRRGLDKSLITSLSSCRWIAEHHNLFVTGPTGVGKSFIACALSQKACREGYSALYFRLPRLFSDLSVAKGDGRYQRLLSSYDRTDLLVLDDWGISPLSCENRRDLLEILDDRYGNRSTLITSQLPVGKWYEYLDDPTLADAILDRVVHNAYKIELKGESMRKKKGTPREEKTDKE
jgi:DNA replication protein DnaC